MSVRIPRQPDIQPLDPVQTVYILDEDVAASETLCAALTRHGYRARALADAAEALATLRASDELCALFFNVEAYGKTLDGRGFASLIGALLEDPALARSHVFAVISSTPEEVEWALGKLLAHLNARVFEKPCGAAAIDTYLSLASGRISQQPGSASALTRHAHDGA
jgi:hypothetical protein